MLVTALALTAVAQQTRSDVKQVTGTSQFAPMEFGNMSSSMQVTKCEVKKLDPARVAPGNVIATLQVEDYYQNGGGFQLFFGPERTFSAAQSWAEMIEAVQYSVPVDADIAYQDGQAEHFIIEGQESIEIPAGTYDYFIGYAIPAQNYYTYIRRMGIQMKAGYEYVFTVTDAVGVTEVNIGAPEVPTELAVGPTSTTAEVLWDAGEYNESCNLRYRQYVVTDMSWDFEDESDLEGWSSYDADGDGNTWYLYTDAVTFNTVLTSASWDMYAGPLSPDNWIISPEIPMGGTLSMNIWGQDLRYPAEHFAVYLYVGDNLTSMDQFVAISDELVSDGDANALYEFDLSEYEGVGRFAVRHYNIYDEFRINLDNVAVTFPDVEPYEWTYVENVTCPYLITDLTPETEYEVQVQGVTELGESNWSQSVIFTTLPEGPSEVTEVSVDKADSDTWYNIAGMKLNARPTERGIYIHNGKKVVIK